METPRNKSICQNSTALKELSTLQATFYCLLKTGQSQYCHSSTEWAKMCRDIEDEILLALLWLWLNVFVFYFARMLTHNTLTTELASLKALWVSIDNKIDLMLDMLFEGMNVYQIDAHVEEIMYWCVMMCIGLPRIKARSHPSYITCDTSYKY